MSELSSSPPSTAATGFGIENLPYGVFDAGAGRRIGVRIDDDVLDVAAMADRVPDLAPLLTAPVLNPLLAAGPRAWRAVRAAVREWVAAGPRHPLADLTLHLPYDVADYVDFYASEHHASNVGRIFGREQPLHPNWRHLPCGYHGRTSSIVVSGTPVRRPHGQRGAGDFGPSQRLDLEVEVGFLLGPGSSGPIPTAGLAEHVFGVFLLNDWSARDLQAWETVPLGPLLGKSFATSVSPWVVPLDALTAAWVDPPPQDPEPLPYLRGGGELKGLDLDLTLCINGHAMSRPPFASMYWTPAQMLAHLTVNGAPTRPGDVFASGTVSGPERGQRGSLLELSWGGAEPVALPDGSTRTFLRDGDDVAISATAPGPGGARIGFGEVRGTVAPA